jgi:hypothetical protein
MGGGVLGRVFRPKRDEVTGECRKPHNEELNDLYFSPNVLRVITSKTIKLAGHVTRIGRREVCMGFGGKSKGKETTGETQA